MYVYTSAKNRISTCSFKMFNMKNNSTMFICLKFWFRGGTWSNLFTWYIYGFPFYLSPLLNVCLGDGGEDPDITLALLQMQKGPCRIFA